MGLWRVAIDETSGVTSGDPQPLATPAWYVADFSLSADGAVGVYSSLTETNNVARVGFDPGTATIKGDVEMITTGQRLLLHRRDEGRAVRRADHLVTYPGGSVRLDGRRPQHAATHERLRTRSAAAMVPRCAVDLLRFRPAGLSNLADHADGSGLRQLTNERV